ncbi:hypothetical protein S820908_037 [Synechococcus phage S-CAM9]|uniref:Uncharacterized protein n=1 Tax=Synechococcus phage S-CAM9 TaxID=1883369 RepID=A0A1D8KNF1_9CAUD|nr:2OG-Fe(II) oxygenase [Synechococcus phage S-CAM9]AOV60184.1 hypothetical protein S050808_037 [Synechococcus phage S-CAM9]AOV60412.1 hypothetical protein S820908_037 [Synechococcus phage S-CAM9]AOV60640.1 hypothetical protein N161109_037 [Synechococcus phage S-CAM9]
MKDFINTVVDVGDIEDTKYGYFHPMFSTPILHVKIDNWIEKKRALLKLFDTHEKNCSLWEETDVFGVETDFHRNLNKNNKNRCNYNAEVADILFDELEFASEAFGIGVVIGAAWFEKSKKGTHHGAHHHGPIGLSAVCFIEYDKNHHTPTIFMNPNCSSVKEYFTPPHVSEGSLIIFPSNIVHYTTPNISDENRIVLAFNMTVAQPAQ